MVRLNDTGDEIEQFENMRSIGSLEACSRLFSIPQSERFPSVQQLTVHLPLEQIVVFNEGEERLVLQDERSHKTELTEFFQINLMHPNVKTKYCDFPELFKWSIHDRQWSKRKVKTGTIGRVFTVHPSCGERFYLRILLHHDFCRGLSCY